MATEQSDRLPETPPAFDPWRQRFAARLHETLAPWPEPVPPDLEITDDEAGAGFRRQRVVFDSEDTMSVPAYLLVPDDRRDPGSAVLAVHGHGPGSHGSADWTRGRPRQ